MMRTLTRLVSIAVLAIGSAAAQTTGVPGINDYTLNSLGSGSSSCTMLCFPTPVVLNHAVSTASGNVVVFVWTFCTCVPCLVSWPSNACTPAIPATACGSTTNQGLDLNLSCPLFVVGISVAVGGVATTTLSIPPLVGAPCFIARSATQAVVIAPCGLGGGGVTGPFVLTQGYNLNF